MLDDCETPLMVWKWTLTGLAAAPYYVLHNRQRPLW